MEIVKYDITDAAISEMGKRYMGLTIKDLDDKEGFDSVHDARMIVKGKRVEVEKARVKFKAEALEYGRKVDGEAKRIFGLLEPIETHLQTEEDKITKEKARIKAEEEEKFTLMVNARVEALLGFNVVLPFAEVAGMEDIDFSERLDEAKATYEDKQNRLAEEEKERIARQAELNRKEEEQAKKDKEVAEKEDALRSEREAFEREKREAEEKKNREAFEKQAKEDARIQAEKDAKEKIEREAKEAKEKEDAEKAEVARQEALKPDREKMLEVAKAFRNFPFPEVQSEEAKNAFGMVKNDLTSMATFLETTVKEEM